ncbi:MAG: amidohydrolase family protein [Methanotrichaceae archaeon]
MSQIQVAASEPTGDSLKASIVLQCGNVWDGQADALLGPMEILVQDGKIADMDRKVARPAGAKIISLPNRTVTPGFTDCHAHMAFPRDNFAGFFTLSQAQVLLKSLKWLRQTLLEGFTTVRDVAAAPMWNFVTVDMKHAIEQGLIVGPRMIVAPHGISATGGHGDMGNAMSYEVYSSMEWGTIADGPDAIQKAVREDIKGGADWIKCTGTGGFVSPTSDPGVPTYTQEEMNILVRTAHDQGIPVAVHAYGDEGVKRAIIAGVDSIEHGNMASIEALKMMEKKGTFMVPTQFCFEDALVNLNNKAYWDVQPIWVYKKTVKYAPAIIECAKNLAESRVKIAFGTDAGTFPTPGDSTYTWKEFPTMVKNGIAPLRALKAATSVAAELLRRPDLGTLAVGKTADIIAMPGDPFQDINVTGQVDFVMKEGKIYRQP